MTSYKTQILVLVPLLSIAMLIAVLHGDGTGESAVVSTSVVLLIVLYIAHRLDFPQRAVWGLTIAVIIHLAGSVILIGDTRFYELMLIPILPSFYLLRFDKVVHFFASAAIYYLIVTLLARNSTRFSAFYAALATLGIGSLNEMGEFTIASIFYSNPERFGGLIDTETDMIANLVGVAVMMIVLAIWRKRLATSTHRSTSP